MPPSLSDYTLSYFSSLYSSLNHARVNISPPHLLQTSIFTTGPVGTPIYPHCANVVDVAVIGAGLSGLAAAKALVDAGRTATVLEARTRIGGRVENRDLQNGGVTELGAAFVGPTQDHVLDLIEELGLEIFPEYNSGLNQALVNDDKITYAANSSIPPMDAESTAQLISVMESIDAMAASIDVNSPWSHTNASKWDSITFETWMDQNNFTDALRFLFGVTIPAVFSLEPSELSFFYTLSYIAAAGNETMNGTLNRLLSVTDGGQESRIIGGTGLLATGLADKIGWNNIVLGTPIRSIARQSNGTYLVSAANCTVLAKHVIVAMSPPLAGRIVYSPQLPAQRDQLMQRMFMGSLGKATAIYSTPFWRADNLSGQTISSSGLVRVTFDVSPKDGSYGAILGFIEADEMRSVDDATEDEIAAVVTKDYVRYFGPQAAQVQEWAIQRWDNEIYSRGGPVALAGPGTLSKYGPALRKPCGGIHWAGTEAGEYWTGYMDGAIRSGQRAAREILDIL